jgi:uncharacterized protein
VAGPWSRSECVGDRADGPLLYPDARVLIFAKAPIPGQVKTRLIPALGASGAAELATELLERLVRRLATVRLAPVELWCSPDPDHSQFRGLADAWGVSLHTQHGADLGERLENAADDALRRAKAVLLVGADIPELDAAYCARALGALERAESVLGRAEDGGYVLLGLKARAPSIFRGMPWGGDRVGAMTKRRIEQLGWRCEELETLWDLDRPDDLARYRRLDGEADAKTDPVLLG